MRALLKYDLTALCLMCEVIKHYNNHDLTTDCKQNFLTEELDATFSTIGNNQAYAMKNRYDLYIKKNKLQALNT